MPESRLESSGMFYRKTGTGPAVVLLHGFPANGKLWRNIWGDLSVLHTVVVPDLPGSGESAAVEGTAGMEDMARMVKEILDKEKIEKAVIAGHSMGGYVALAFARLFPEAVAGISLVHSITTADDEEKVKTRRKAIELLQKGGKKQFLNQVIPGLFSPAFREQSQAVIAQQTDEAMQLSESVLISFYEGMIERRDNTSLLPSAAYPIHWIAGLEDTVIPFKKILEKCHFSDVNFVSFYNNCGHMSMLEVPQNLVTDLLEFSTYCHSRYS